MCESETEENIKSIPDIVEHKSGEVVFEEEEEDLDDWAFDDDEDDQGENFEDGEELIGNWEEGQQIGGGANQSNSNLNIDLEGKKIKISDLFTSKMVQKDPTLFLKKKTGKFSAYSRICPSNVRRQPVLLTDEEKEKIDAKHPNSYSDAVKYGSDHKFWYICPRYWCLTGNYSLTEKEVKEGVCGGEKAIIPESAKVIPKGGQIFEFTSKNHKNSDGTYATHGPSLIPGKHPDGYCIPCCFKTWKSKAQIKKREQCLEPRKTKKANVGVDDYIKGAEKIPLSQNRWGFLPLSVQKMLQFDNKKCYSNQTKLLKQNYMCLLRHGVQNNPSQSFIGAMADIYSKLKRNRVPPEIIRMKEIIIDSFNIDSFVTFQNGDLVELFGDFNSKISIEKYKKTKIFKLLKPKTKNHMKYFQKIISAFENFIKFLRNENSIINYEYLWDIICQPNLLLFSEGLNLVIFNLPDDDVTDNIELICPSNHNGLFNLRKPSVFLMSKNGYYEPIYGYTTTDDSIMITPVFKTNQRGIPNEIINTLHLIKNLFLKCKPLASMPKQYTFKENIMLDKLEEELQKINFNIIKLIINFNSKVIGVIAQNNTTTGFLPCKPSPIDNKFEYLLMDDENIWSNYNPTIKFLNDIYILSKKKIPSLPHSKVEEDNIIVGILTITNQFVPLKNPQEKLPDDLNVISGYNYLKNDELTIFNDKIDMERVRMSKRIKLEGHFFNVFRNTVRILLQEYRNKKIRREIEDIIKKPYIIYSQKLDLITEILKKIVQKHIKFVDFTTEVYDEY